MTSHTHITLGLITAIAAIGTSSLATTPSNVVPPALSCPIEVESCSEVLSSVRVNHMGIQTVVTVILGVESDTEMVNPGFTGPLEFELRCPDTGDLIKVTLTLNPGVSWGSLKSCAEFDASDE